MSQQSSLGKFFKSLIHAETTPGMLLLTAMTLALILDNSSLAHLYDALLQTPAGIAVGTFALQNHCCFGSTMASWRSSSF